MQKKNLLFEDDEPEQAGSLEKLNVNEDFKRKFEYNKRRQLLEQGKLKYGDLIEGDASEEESESSSSDDSEGELVNPRFERKFMEVITAIRDGDPSVLTKTGDSNIIGEPVFKDEDFEDDSESVEVKPKKVTLKD